MGADRVTPWVSHGRRHTGVDTRWGFTPAWHAFQFKSYWNTVMARGDPGLRAMRTLTSNTKKSQMKLHARLIKHIKRLLLITWEPNHGT